MSARHLLREPRETNPFRAAFGKAWRIVFGSIIVAAALSALVVNVVGSRHTPSPAAQQQVSQEGTLVAVSEGSVTARSRDGITRTYLLTPDTAVIARAGGRFAVNDEVAIVGTIQNGTALATAVAHRELGHGAGPPMDYVAVQPVSGALGTD